MKTVRVCFNVTCVFKFWCFAFVFFFISRFWRIWWIFTFELNNFMSYTGVIVNEPICMLWMIDWSIDWFRCVCFLFCLFSFRIVWFIRVWSVGNSVTFFYLFSYWIYSHTPYNNNNKNIYTFIFHNKGKCT